MNPYLSVQAVVNDNVQNSSLEQTIGSYSDTQESQTVFGMLRKILNNLSTFSSFFGIGRELIVPTDAQYSSATLIEKINYLEKQNETLISNMALLDTKVQNVYVTAASNAYANAQVRSVVATGVAPSEILVKWDCTKDVNCTSNSSYPDRIDDSMIKEFRVYCSDKDASIKSMVLRGTVPYDAGKLYTADYSFAINKLSPDKTYYVWVTAVIDDADGIELKDNSSVKVIKTLTISSTKVTELTATPTDGTTLSISWKDGLNGISTKSEYINSYQVFWSADELNEANVLSCTSYKNVTTCSTNITGLTAGTYYYIAVVPVMRDSSIGSSGKLQDAVSVIYTCTAYLLTYSVSSSGTSDNNVICKLTYVDLNDTVVTVNNGSSSVYVKPDTDVTYNVTAYYSDLGYGDNIAYACYWNGIQTENAHKGAAHCFVNNKFKMNNDHSVTLTGQGNGFQYAGNTYVGNTCCCPCYYALCSGGVTVD